MSEYLARYWHSHLSWGREYYPIEFCLSDLEISMVRLRINAILNDNGSIDALKHEVIGLYLLMDTLATWESLEGGPHRKIKDIKASCSDRRDCLNFNPTQECYNKIFSFLTKSDIEVVQDVVNLRYSKSLTDKILEYQPLFTAYEDSNGEIFS